MTFPWGTELWDKYPELTSHFNGGLDFLDGPVAGFVKERGQIEADYAKKLRTLVKKYMPKEPPKPKQNKHDNNNGSVLHSREEFTHIKAFRQMLTELGFQAGQHEVLAEHLCKERKKSIQDDVKRLRERLKRNQKDMKKIADELEATYKSMEASRDKFRKAFEEQERSHAAYSKASEDGNVTRNELEKLRLQSNQKGQQCEKAKGKYAHQLVSTNDYQGKYYNSLLPRVMNDLQDLEKKRVEILKTELLRSLNKEIELMPIVSKCHEAIRQAIGAVDPEDDSDIVVERFKSGDVPPGDFRFEDMSDPQAMLTYDALEKPRNLNLYPRKRELEKLIEDANGRLAVKDKELASLERMVAAYRGNSKFGNSKQFETEIQPLKADIANLRTDLSRWHNELSEVERKLQDLRSRSPMVHGGTVKRGAPQPNGGVRDSSPLMHRNRSARGSQSSGSLKSSSLSIGGSSGGGGHHVTTTPNGGAPSSNHSSENPYEETMDFTRESSWEPSDLPPPPPPMPSAVPGRRRMAVALYPFNESVQDFQDSNIAMAEGEEFEIVEEDGDGWTRVRRLGGSYANTDEEGYVPTSFLKVL